MISSITILGWSFFPQHLSASPEIQLAKKKKVRIVNAYKGKGIEERTRKIGMATRVPAVPGALGTYPAPRPDANSRMKRFIFSGFKGSRVQGFKNDNFFGGFQPCPLEPSAPGTLLLTA
jgi:hypothetical protein